MLQTFARIGKDVIHLHVTGNIPYYQTFHIIKYYQKFQIIKCPHLQRDWIHHANSTDCAGGLCLPHLSSDIKTGHLHLHQRTQHEQQMGEAESPGTAGKL